MAKPIVFVKVPRMTMGQTREARANIDKLFEHEYHVLVFPTNEDEMEVQVFNDPNLTEANFEQLKEMVEAEIYHLKYPKNLGE